MSFLRRLLGIPEQKIIYTKDSLIHAIRKLVPAHKLDQVEDKLMREFRQISEGLCHEIANGLLQFANLPESRVRDICNHQFIEHWVTNYALNSFLTGWGLGVAERQGKGNLFSNEVNDMLVNLMNELRQQSGQLFHDANVTEVFLGVSRMSFEVGKEVSAEYRF